MSTLSTVLAKEWSKNGPKVPGFLRPHTDVGYKYTSCTRRYNKHKAPPGKGRRKPESDRDLNDAET